MEMRDFTGSEGIVVARETMTGTLLDIPPSGNKIHLKGTPVWRVKNGKIVEDWPNFDGLALMRQVGAVSERKAQPG